MLRIRATRRLPGAGILEDVTSTETLGDALHARYTEENRHLAEARVASLDADKEMYGLGWVTYSVERDEAWTIEDDRALEARNEARQEAALRKLRERARRAW